MGRRIARGHVQAVVLSGCWGSSGASTFEDAQAGLSDRLPGGWRIVEARPTSVVDPRQLLTVATFPLRQSRPDPNCAPRTARAQMPADGALVQIVEYTRRLPARLPRRPPRLELPRRPVELECTGLGYTVEFAEHGRRLQAVALVGARAGERRRQEILELLNGLRVAPRGD
jgi:hypothetical protein